MQYRIAPEGLLTFGFTVDGSQIDGVCLETFGLVSSCFSPFVPGISIVVSTGWTTIFGTSSTVWTGMSTAPFC